MQAFLVKGEKVREDKRLVDERIVKGERERERGRRERGLPKLCKTASEATEASPIHPFRSSLLTQSVGTCYFKY